MLNSLKQRFFFCIVGDKYDTPELFVELLFVHIITTESLPDAFTVCNHLYHIQDVYIIKALASLGIPHNTLGVQTLY